MYDTLRAYMDDPAYSDEIENLELTDDELATLNVQDRIVYAVGALGHKEAKEIKEVAGFSQAHTRELAQELAENGRLTMARPGRSYQFGLPGETLVDMDTSEDDTDASDDDPPAVDDRLDEMMAQADADDLDELAATVEHALEATMDGGDGRMPVFRDHDWSSWELGADEVTEYVPTDGEYGEIQAMLDSREDTGMLPHFSLIGPSGTAKTMLAKNIAHDRDAPYFEVQCGEGMRVADLLGSPTVTEGEDGNTETWWADQTVTKALLASKEREVVLCLDEISRAPPRALGLLFGMLDHRCRVQLPAPIAGENPVKGDPMNLIVVSTMNKSTKSGTYHVNEIDDAQWRRLGRAYEVEFLGQHDKNREVALVTDKSPAGVALASQLVEVANTIREQAAERRSEFAFDLGPALVIEWARTAWALDGTGDDPVLRAAERTFITPYCAGDDEAEGAVYGIVEDQFGGLHDVTEPSVRDHFGMGTPTTDADEEESVYCEVCAFETTVEEAESVTLATMLCPECDGQLTEP